MINLLKSIKLKKFNPETIGWIVTIVGSIIVLILLPLFFTLYLKYCHWLFKMV